MKRILIAGTVAVTLLHCGRTTPVVPPSPPAAIAAEEMLPASLEEAEKLLASGDREKYERALRALAASNDTTLARDAAVRVALFVLRQDRFGDAVPLLEAAATAAPDLAPYLRERIVEASIQWGDIPRAVAAAEAIVGSSPASTAATVARLRLPALYARSGNDTAAVSAVNELTNVAIDELTEGHFVRLAVDLEQTPRSDLARAIWKRLLLDYTGGRHTEQTHANLFRDEAILDELGVEGTLSLASRLAQANRYDQSLDLLGRLIRKWPAASESDAYRAVRARALFHSRRYEQLLVESEGWKSTDPAIGLLRARAAWRSDRPEIFLTRLREIETSHPSSKEAIEVRILRSKYHTTDNTDYAKAVHDLQKAIDAGALGNDGEHLWTLGWTHTLWGKHDQALNIFDRYIQTYADGDYKTNSLFWSAKIHDRRGEITKRDAFLRQITAEYPYSYYAYRSREILGDTAPPPVELNNGNVFPDIAAEIAATADPRVAVVAELLRNGMRDDAMREMKAIATAHPENLGIAFLLADVYVAGGEPFKANGVLQRRFRKFVRHGGSGIPARFWEILFPLNYWSSIVQEARKRSLDPYLVASIIRQESGFEPTTVSNAGAVGLMQIMPAEAARIAAAGGLPEPTRSELLVPERNIAVGAAEYSQKLATMKGNHILAIAAYNAGEDAVGRWLAQTPIDDVDTFIESIPFAETRLYVKTVSRNRFEYRRIYEGSTKQHDVQQSVTQAPPSSRTLDPRLH